VESGTKWKSQTRRGPPPMQSGGVYADMLTTNR
jgi:hypothetical protein